jgi:hypothetical protein
MTCNIYVASCHRWGTTTVYKRLEYCTYVVRKSEESQYAALGIKPLAVEDSQINSFAKVQNWLIENAPEDIVAVLDDDINNFYYRLDKVARINDSATVTAEIERMCQLLADLDIGLLGTSITGIPYGYTAEFSLSAMIGPIRIYNRSRVKARYIAMPFFSDTDFVLQELKENRIILRPSYLTTDAKLETNAGGMNTGRHMKHQLEEADKMRRKWGKHFYYSPRNNVTKIVVRR